VDEQPAQRLHALLMELVRMAGLLQLDSALPGHAISLSQAFTLHEVDRPSPPSQQDLAERLRLEKSTVSRLVSDLERRALVVRERDPDNRRLYRLSLTDEGRAQQARMVATFDAQYRHWMSMMTEVEAEALVVGLDALVRVMRQRPVEHGGHRHPPPPA
jgi:DNA-binding MarR family transcriptional regulator